MSKKHKYKFQGEEVYAQITPSEQRRGERDFTEVPKENLLDIHSSSLCFGTPKNEKDFSSLVGMKMGEEGHSLIIGGSGSGKSTGIINPTLALWEGAIVVTDIKGELSAFYNELCDKGKVKRPAIVFDPTSRGSPSYDVFYLLIHDDPCNLVENAKMIVYAIFPSATEEKEKFWRESTQSLFLAILLYCVNACLSFNETITFVMQSSLYDIFDRIKNGSYDLPKMYLGSFGNMAYEVISLIDRELRNGLAVFVEPNVQNALKGERDGEKPFTWDMLDEYNIFLSVPEYRIEAWGGLINLMYAQLMYHLSLRPDKHSPEGANNIPTLLLMDEFPRFGRLDWIKNAVATLRSKSVNICLVVQSLAQLDSIYGISNRRIIMDNCQFKAILNANDPETQKTISDLIGTMIFRESSTTDNFDIDMDFTGSSESISSNRDYIVHPHELSTLKDVILLTPNGNCRIDKLKIFSCESSFLGSTNMSGDFVDQVVPEPVIHEAKAVLMDSLDKECVNNIIFATSVEVVKR